MVTLMVVPTMQRAANRTPRFIGSLHPPFPPSSRSAEPPPTVLPLFPSFLFRLSRFRDARMQRTVRGWPILPSRFIYRGYLSNEVPGNNLRTGLTRLHRLLYGAESVNDRGLSRFRDIEIEGSWRIRCTVKEYQIRFRENSPLLFCYFTRYLIFLIGLLLSVLQFSFKRRRTLGNWKNSEAVFCENSPLSLVFSCFTTHFNF